MYAKKNKISLNNMYGIYIIILFVIISVIGNLYIFNDENIYNIKIEDKYLPSSNIIIFIWILIFGILGHMYVKINVKKDKYYITRVSLMFYVTICFIYGLISENKSIRFIKNYNYFAFLLLIYLTYIINKNAKISNLYFIPLYLWIGYISFLTLLDDLKILDFYKNQ